MRAPGQVRIFGPSGQNPLATPPLTVKKHQHTSPIGSEPDVFALGVGLQVIMQVERTITPSLDWTRDELTLAQWRANALCRKLLRGLNEAAERLHTHPEPNKAPGKRVYEPGHVFSRRRRQSDPDVRRQGTLNPTSGHEALCC